MAGLTIPAPHAATSPPRWPAWLPALALLAMLRLAAPGGYLGGGSDDYHYLAAARCIAEHGWCLPDTHWASRWPLVAPMGTLIAFGGAPLAVALVPLAYAVAALALLATAVERVAGRAAATVAALALVATPAFAGPALQPAVDIPELAWALAALVALQVAARRASLAWAAVAGVWLALAVMTRMTALALLPVVALGWPLLPRPRIGMALASIAGLAMTLAAEAACYGWATGDPAYGWALSLHHTRIPSTELAPGVDFGRGALFNLDLVRHWRRSMGIEMHWSVDWLLNLLADPRSGLTLLAGALLTIAYRRHWRGDARIARMVVLTGAGALLHALLLVFVLAIAPKPRMMLPELAAAATLAGIVGTRAWAAGERRLPVALAALMLLRATVVAADTVDPRAAGDVAAAWLAEAGGGAIATDEWSRRTLALVPAAAALGAPRADTRLLTVTSARCAAPGRRLLRERRFDRAEPAPVSWLRARGIVFGAREVPTLCLFAPSAGRAGSPRS